MENPCVAFQLIGKENIKPVDYEEIKCHLIFDVKMDLTRKAHYFSGKHMPDPTFSMTYSRVFSQESVCIEFIVDSQ